MDFLLYFLIGLALFSIVRVLATGFYTVRPDQRAVLTSFRAPDLEWW